LAGEVHVWRAHFRTWRQRLPELGSSLPAEEIERAARFLRDRDRERYIFAHGILRWILGFCCDCEPADLVFASGEHGKPFLVDPPSAGANLEFNLSHSGDCVLVATAFGAHLGVDVEQTTRAVEFEDLSDRFFSTDEATVVRNTRAENRCRVFFDTWVCKEAFIKAVGLGLTMPLDSFSIHFDGTATRLTAVSGKPNEHLEGAWTMERFEVSDDYVGALAVRSHDVDLNRFLLE
jgi:4'-phosphopantetheinyl transferase